MKFRKTLVKLAGSSRNFSYRAHHPLGLNTAQKMKFSIKGFFSKCDQIRKKLRIWSHLLKKSLMENFIFCAVNTMCLSIKTRVIVLTHSIFLYA